MIQQQTKWNIESEWTLESAHFKYHYVIKTDLSVCTPQKKIKSEFINYMIEMYGKPSQRWGFRFDRNFDTITVYFNNQEDAIIFRLTHE